DSGAVGRISAAQYNGFTVDVAHLPGPSTSLIDSLAGEFGANSADRSADGNTIGFNYSSPIMATFDSWLEIANTNATTHVAGTIEIRGVDTISLPNIAGFAPGP